MMTKWFFLVLFSAQNGAAIMPSVYNSEECKRVGQEMVQQNTVLSVYPLEARCVPAPEFSIKCTRMEQSYRRESFE